MTDGFVSIFESSSVARFYLRTGNALSEEEARMSKHEFETALLSRLGQQRFQPFLIELSDGGRLVVGLPRALSYLCGPSAIYFDPDGQGMMFHSEAVRHVIDLIPAESA